MQKVLLTGATGRIGRRLARPLSAAGHDVTALIRSRGALSPTARAEQEGLGALRVVEGDLSGRLASVRGTEWDTIVHAGLDGSAFPRDARAQRRLNVDATLDLIETLRPRRFVLMSTVRLAGARRGVALESEFDVGQAFHNTGEECMLEVEVAARAAGARAGVDVLILRLGHVEGRGSDGGMDSLSAFVGLVASEAWNPRHWRSQLRVPGLKPAPMALTPAAWLGSAVAALVGATGEGGGCLHLLAGPPTQEAFFAAVADRADLPGLRVQTPRRGALRNPTRLEARAHASLGLQMEHLSADLAFDRAEAQRRLNMLGVTIPDLAGPALNSYVGALSRA